jgi:hypothetical protein
MRPYLKGIIRIFGWNGVKSLSIGCIIAFDGAEVDGAGDFAFVCMAMETGISQANTKVWGDRNCSGLYLCTRCGPLFFISGFSMERLVVS